MRRWRRWIAILVILLLAAAIACWISFEYLPKRRAMNERTAATMIKILSLAEVDFRDHDRDGNRVKDFWTGDVSGLFRAGLIERDLAEADASPITPLCAKPVPYEGYYFVALQGDASVAPPESYRRDTDKKSGDVHHPEKYGFLAYPANPGRSGKYYYMINERNCVWRAPLEAPLPTHWPPDAELKMWWSQPE